ncbi:MAG: hypothetical protein K2H72_07645 [Muribaculaceae bacterium]|nr:hypothetical protein [Muribaculaceae bacterium]
MEEDKLKDLFKSYDPELSSSRDFIERLERNLNVVELIHRDNAAVLKRNRIAVAIASVAGFITGVVFSLLLPYIEVFVNFLLSSLLSAFRLPDVIYGNQVVSWLLVGAISVLVGLNTYTITLSIQPSRDARRED